MGKVWDFFTPLVNGNKPDKEIESGVKQVLSNLEYLVKQNEILGLKEGPSAGIQLEGNRFVCERASTTRLKDESSIYGRNADKEIIVNKLLLHNMEGNQLPADVIAIHGMGGMGKTTLAQLVYDDVRIKNQFQHRACVCVSEGFDVYRVTKEILHSLNCPTKKLNDLHSCQSKLEEILRDKKLFLVLDDVWNENHQIWETFQAPLKHVAPQSKILITTRNGKVAEVMCCAFTHPLKPLEDEDCWKLFAKHAFNDQCDVADQSLVKIGRLIVKKCGGCPLAIKTLGSLLHKRLSTQYWDKILKSDIWQLSENDSNIIPSLRLSYHYLPSNMKRCFAYCSIFAKDYDIAKNLLIQLWMANGLICPTQKSMSLEEEGNEIFNDLRSRSFFEPSRKGSDFFSMHDLLNDLAKSVAGEFFFRIEVGQATVEDMSSKTRYFSCTSDRDECLKAFDQIFKCHQLRTFLLKNSEDLYPYQFHMYGDIMSGLSHLKYIRELSLRGYRLKNITDDIGNLKHLHYLDLSWTSIKKLPNSICLLINLQTLKLNGCSYLTKLPSHLCKLINLRHLDLYLCGIKKMPKHMGKLTQLRTMNQFVVVRKGGSNIKELGALKHLTGSLTISHMELINDATDVREANLKEKELDELYLQYENSNYSHEEAQHQEQVLEAFEPNHNIKRIHIRGYAGTKFPKWDMFPSPHHLTLWRCFAMESLPLGGMLSSSLRSLSMVSCPKLIASCRDWGLHELLSLNKLYIAGCVDMESFPDEGLLPPNLRSLSFHSCPNLRRINFRGLVHLHSLTSLYFFGCPSMSFEEDMPEVVLPPSLSHLTIYDCPLLVERCEKDKGPDWPKIAHIPHVYVDVIVRRNDEEEPDWAL